MSSKLSKAELLEFAKLSSRAKNLSVHLRLSSEEFRRLDYLAKRHNVTRSDVLRASLHHFQGIKH